ncbi:MAG: ABC transporter permease subunit [Anaerolineae bacterium]|nr:ABC transporter permease subunit [Anaerolineae bacterium]
MSAPPTPSSSSVLRDVRFIRAFVQIVFIVSMTLLVGWFVNNGRQGLNRLGIKVDFGFLNTPSNVQIDEGLSEAPHAASDTFAHAFVIGVINTLRVVVIGLILATIVGLIMGVARLSSNWLVRTLSTIYIEIAQNTPLLVQLVFIYSGVILTLPPARNSITLPGPLYLSVRGFATPALWPTDNTALWTLIMLVALVIGVVIWRQRTAIQIETGRPTYGFEIGVGLMLLIGVISAILLHPYLVSLPEIRGPRYAPGVGVVVSPEFFAITVGLVLYTGAYIAEIIRSGIQAVPNGQWEAARAQGFSYVQTLRFIVLPQAMRVAIPPLTNQYLNLIKNSSLAGIVGYQDIFGVGKIGFESGQTVPVVIIVMVLYLILDLFTAFLMNIINARVQFKTR